MKTNFWQDMRNNEFILVDAQTRKLAVFANQSGEVVMASLEDGYTHVTTIEPNEIGNLIASLNAAKVEAQLFRDAIEPELQAHVAISKAMGGV